MPDDLDFAGLVLRLRDGCPLAAERLIAEYEPQIRRVITARLRDPLLRRQVDTVDICQSVLGDFFVRAALGQFEFASPNDLIALLATMARNKISRIAAAQKALKRDVRRVVGEDIAGFDVPSTETSPSVRVACEELLEQVRKRLSPADRYLADQRKLGRSWADIASEVGGQADALRIRLKRNIDRIAVEFGLC